MKTPSTFNLTVAAVLSLTVISGGTATHLGSQPELTEQQDRLFDGALTTWSLGTASLFGLLANRPEDEDEQDEQQ
jgi:hypothetical protein